MRTPTTTVTSFKNFASPCKLANPKHSNAVLTITMIPSSPGISKCLLPAEYHLFVAFTSCSRLDFISMKCSTAETLSAQIESSILRWLLWWCCRALCRCTCCLLRSFPWLCDPWCRRCTGGWSSKHLRHGIADD